MPDSTAATMAHKNRVQDLLGEVVLALAPLAVHHDDSKLEEPEKKVFDVFTPRLKHLEYGTPEYKSALGHMKPALDHHYAHNRHHPEHHEEGIYGMDILDLLEMLADWKAAGERHRDNKGLAQSIETNAKRYNFGEGLKRLLIRTAERMKWL